MRAAALPVLALPLLLTYCGAKQDLIIGELATITEAGTAGSAGIGAGAEPGISGALSGGTGGVGGTGEVGGTSEGGAEVVGTAGAGSDSGDRCVAGQEPALDSLIHRYSFDGTGTVATDSISGADGTLVGGPMLDGSGLLSLEGSPTRQHVNLPDDLVSSLSELTVVAWMTWSGGAGYQRVFDFGISNSGEVQGASGTRYFAVMPSTGFENGMAQGLGAEIKAPGFPTLQLASTEDMLDRAAQVGFVFRSAHSAELYLDGNLLAAKPTEIPISDIDDRNNWLGQSQWSKDHNFEGTYEEVRIYNVALNACQLHTLLVRGPQAP